MPGATLTGVEGDSFTGTMKVKLGPVVLLYKGTGTFTERDEQARRAVRHPQGDPGAFVGDAIDRIDLDAGEIHVNREFLG